MTPKDTSTGSGRASKKDPLIGRSYLCCRGPRKGEAVTVMGLVEASEGDDQSDPPRYRLESERGGAWTISSEPLRRIFGSSSKRSCNCHPLDAGAVEEEVTTTEPPQIEEEAQAAEAELVEAGTPEVSEAATDSEAVPVSQVIYEENNAQGSLFS
jgi:hypothetical protein